LPPKRQIDHFELVLKVVSIPKDGDGLFKAPRPEASLAMPHRGRVGFADAAALEHGVSA
jgi:hypothetical protein